MREISVWAGCAAALQAGHPDRGGAAGVRAGGRDQAGVQRKPAGRVAQGAGCDRAGASGPESIPGRAELLPAPRDCGPPGSAARAGGRRQRGGRRHRAGLPGLPGRGQRGHRQPLLLSRLRHLHPRHAGDADQDSAEGVWPRPGGDGAGDHGSNQARLCLQPQQPDGDDRDGGRGGGVYGARARSRAGGL